MTVEDLVAVTRARLETRPRRVVPPGPLIRAAVLVPIVDRGEASPPAAASIPATPTTWPPRCARRTRRSASTPRASSHWACSTTPRRSPPSS